ncbi:SEC-C metal-binding domain-containing protein [Xanthomonas cissicola]|nr:SEC-C metal-binding domain-containing protein [Xanthomonas cissicola]
MPHIANWQPKGLYADNKGPKIGRNDQCPCGSGRKYKHCCATSAPTFH